MANKITLDTDKVLDTSKSIKNISSEISNSIASLQKTSNDLVINSEDQNMVKFKENFDDYLAKLNNMVIFYNNITTNIDNYVKEISELENSSSSELKKVFESENNG